MNTMKLYIRCIVNKKGLIHGYMVLVVNLKQGVNRMFKQDKKLSTCYFPSLFPLAHHIFYM